jgi:hypothetical protein
MHQPDSERAATGRAVGKLADELTGVEVMGRIHYAQFPTRCVLMTASSLADRALQMVRWGLDRVRSGSPTDHAINRRNIMGEVVLEGVDLLVDCMEHRLRPRPESPHRPSVKLQR